MQFLKLKGKIIVIYNRSVNWWQFYARM